MKSNTSRKNLLTPAGAERLRSELKELKYKTRPEVTKIVAWAAGNGDRSENGDYTYNKRRLREIDRRIRFLSKRLENAEIIDPLTCSSDQVMFGATVKLLTEDDQEKIFTVVDVDEADLSKSRISLASPLGRALLKRRVGDCVVYQTPRGEQEIEILSIEYVPILHNE